MIEYRMEPPVTAAGGQTTSGQLSTSTSIKKGIKCVHTEREQLPTRSHSPLLTLTEETIMEGRGKKKKECPYRNRSQEIDMIKKTPQSGAVCRVTASFQRRPPQQHTYI